MDSKDIKETFQDWHRITMPNDIRQRVHEHLEKTFAYTHSQRTKRVRPWVGVVSAAAVFTVATAIFGVVSLQSVHDRAPKAKAFTNSTTNTPAVPEQNQYAIFQPPKGLVTAFNESAANGTLFIGGYCTQTMLNTQTTTDYFRAASEAYVVVNTPDGKQIVIDKVISPKGLVTVHKPLWFSAGGVWYAVVNNEYEGSHITIYEFTPSSNSMGWNSRIVMNKTFDVGQLSYKSGNKLLIRSEAIGLPEQLYSFSPTGLQPERISEDSPKAGSIPNSVTLTLHESVVNENGKPVVTLSGDSSPLHMRIGQILVLRIVGDTSVPVYSDFYADYGDPGDGSLATRLPSPYTNSMLFKIAAPAKHGSVLFGVNGSLKGCGQSHHCGSIRK